MKLMKETRKLTKEQAELHLNSFGKIYRDNNISCEGLNCDNCMLNMSRGCGQFLFNKHATKHNLTPEQSYAKWRGILKEIVEGEK